MRYRKQTNKQINECVAANVCDPGHTLFRYQLKGKQIDPRIGVNWAALVGTAMGKQINECEINECKTYMIRNGCATKWFKIILILLLLLLRSPLPQGR